MLRIIFVLSAGLAVLVGLALIGFGGLILSDATAVFQEIEGALIMSTGIILLAMAPLYLVGYLLGELVASHNLNATNAYEQGERMLNNLRTMREGMAADFELRQRNRGE